MNYIQEVDRDYIPGLTGNKIEERANIIKFALLFLAIIAGIYLFNRKKRNA